MAVLTDDQVEILQRELDYVTEHPEEWNQGLWGEKTACGTSCCVAGWLLLHNDPEKVGFGPDWVENQYFSVETNEYVKYWSLYARPTEKTLRSRESGEWLYGEENNRWDAGDAINKWFGFPALPDGTDLHDLFNGDNTLADLWYIGQKLAEGRLSVPDEYAVEDYKGWADDRW